MTPIDVKVDVDTADSCNCCFPFKKKEHKKKPHHHEKVQDTTIRDINMVAGDVFVFSKPHEKK